MMYETSNIYNLMVIKANCIYVTGSAKRGHMAQKIKTFFLTYSKTTLKYL